ncbi:MAG: BglII/BstYI family type II restriction endonuclease [Hyphomonadaceae bacterium]|nr:BglII/BstYI family type II restriction endonuclease [Hyphomonadaceae bacterium]
MVTTHLVPSDIHDLYEVHEWRNAAGVLSTSAPVEWSEILTALRIFRLYKSEIATPGGSRSKIVKRLEYPLVSAGWIEKQFKTAIEIDGVSTPSPTHKVDCFKGRIALEVEWNNKDPFFDRDLNNFRLLFDLRVIDCGVIITRSDHLQRTFESLGRGSSFGNSTTHMAKLLPRLDGGGGGGCPVLVFGITDRLLVDDQANPIAPVSGIADDEDDSDNH